MHSNQMNQFLSQAKRLTTETEFIMDILLDNTYMTFFVNGDSIRKMWSTPVAIGNSFRLKNQLLTIYKMMYTRNFNEINLGARVYLKGSDLHYLYRGTCKKNRSENVFEFHVECCEDIKCSWVNRKELEYWCKVVYSHCWENDQKIELYHMFGKKFYEFTILGEYQTLVIGGFYYNIGEFIQPIEETPTPILDMSVKNVVVNLRKPLPEPARKKQKVQPSSVKTNKANPWGPINVSASTFETIKEELFSSVDSMLLSSQDSNDCESRIEMNEATLIKLLEEKRIKFKQVIQLISNDEDLLTSLISSITLIDDPNALSNIIKMHQSKNKQQLNLGENHELVLSVANSLLSKEIDLTNTFFALLDKNQIELCKQITMSIGRLESHESCLCIEKHKISIDSEYSKINLIFTYCIRMILAIEEKIEDDENSRVKKFGKLFSISDALISRLVEDRNTHSHSQIKRSRLKGAIEDRVQCLKHAKSILSKKKPSKKTKPIKSLIQRALEQFQMYQLKSL